MSRVVILQWKDPGKQTLEAYSNLKLLCESHPEFNYNTLNNYLSKAKKPFENERVRIERVQVNNSSVPRKIAMVAKRVRMREHEDEKEDRAYWLSRPPHERLEAVTRLSSLLKAPGNAGMDKTYIIRKKMN